MPLEATQIDLETMILSATNQKEKDRYYRISLLCGI